MELRAFWNQLVEEPTTEMPAIKHIILLEKNAHFLSQESVSVITHGGSHIKGNPTTTTALSINFQSYKSVLSWKKRTPFIKNTSQWQLLALIYLSKFLCDHFRTLLALFTKDVVLVSGKVVVVKFSFIAIWFCLFCPRKRFLKPVFLPCRIFSSFPLRWPYKNFQSKPWKFSKHFFREN